MKKIITFLLIAVVFSEMFFGISYASDIPDVDISVNGEIADLEEKVFLKNNLTYVPLRSFFENMGFEVMWDEKTNVATVKTKENYLKCYPYEEFVEVNGEKNKYIVFENGKIYISLRNSAEFFGAETKWYDDIYTAELIFGENISLKNKKSYTKDDVFWLVKIINAESTGEPLAGKIAVGNVILNRVESEDFPNDIYNVVFDKKYGVQFEPVINGSIYNDHTVECIIASKIVLSGENNVGKSLYFLNPKKATNIWIPNNRTFFGAIGNHDFYL